MLFFKYSFWPYSLLIQQYARISHLMDIKMILNEINL